MNEDEMKITLPPVYWNQYRLQKVINKEIDTLVDNKIIDKKSIYESLISFKRAGANAIITYFADQIKLS